MQCDPRVVEGRPTFMAYHDVGLRLVRQPVREYRQELSIAGAAGKAHAAAGVGDKSVHCRLTAGRGVVTEHVTRRLPFGELLRNRQRPCRCVHHVDTQENPIGRSW